MRSSGVKGRTSVEGIGEVEREGLGRRGGTERDVGIQSKIIHVEVWKMLLI
jgi:hypothetical protein